VKAYSLSRLSGSFFAAALAAAAIVACGRSGLDDGDIFPEPEPDGGGGVPETSVPDIHVPDTAPPPRPCSPSTCSNGCCDSAGTCQRGDSVTLCGSGGGACTNCLGLPNAGCDPNAHKCTSAGLPCTPANCKGCCSGTTCLGGGDSTACGAGGQVCQNCQAIGQQCSLARGSFSCVPPPPPPCNATNCAGCCDATGECLPGFIDSECGQNGAVCIDCTLTASTCDVNIAPRTCTNQQNQCPLTYLSCPAGLLTPTEAFSQNVCSQRELQNAGSACSAGAHTLACSSFFMFEQMQNPACARCLSSFNFDFTELKGILECVSPFVSSTCNHDIACVFDCATQTCQKCPDPPSTQQCEAQSVMAGCATYSATLQTDNCLAQAVLGGGSFCFNQGGNFGAWLQAVGTRYCGQ
jgi:hypothetical protein